jgi:hypothetical protein
MLEHCVKALLSDENISERLVARIVEELLENYRKSENNYTFLKYAWHFAQNVIKDEYYCVGPPLGSSKQPVRVAMLISLPIFLRYICDMSNLWNYSLCEGMSLSVLSPNDLKRSLIEDISVHHHIIARRSPIVWVTNVSNVVQTSADDLADELGMVHLTTSYRDYQELIALEYDVYECELFTPTIVDAQLSPSFVPKPSTSDSRAWNWRMNRWGFTQYVHSSKLVPVKVNVRYIGMVDRNVPELFYVTQQVNITSAELIERFLEGVLRQVLAHIELTPFLSGSQSLLIVSPYDFERFVAALYAREGYITTVTKSSRDGGIDIIATFHQRSKQGILIQAKRTSGVVGISVVRELIGARFLAAPQYENYRLCIATTGRFSKVARNTEEQYPLELTLQDHKDIMKTLKHFSNIGLVDIFYTQMAKVINGG